MAQAPRGSAAGHRLVAVTTPEFRDKDSEFGEKCNDLAFFKIDKQIMLVEQCKLGQHGN